MHADSAYGMWSLVPTPETSVSQEGGLKKRSDFGKQPAQQRQMMRVQAMDSDAVG